MITTVTYDVHAASAPEIRAKAIEALAAFDPDLDVARWTICIDVRAAAITSGGNVLAWCGEVTASRHDSYE